MAEKHSYKVALTYRVMFMVAVEAEDFEIAKQLARERLESANWNYIKDTIRKIDKDSLEVVEAECRVKIPEYESPIDEAAECFRLFQRVKGNG